MVYRANKHCIQGVGRVCSEVKYSYCNPVLTIFTGYIQGGSRVICRGKKSFHTGVGGGGGGYAVN